MAANDEVKKAPTPKADETAAKTAPAAPRKIPGNLPYLAASGTLKKALDRLIEPPRPESFTRDFLENVLKMKGGSAWATIPILKKLGLLSSDGRTTELYGKFRTESGRGQAALQALKNGFPEIFKRSEYAHTVEDGKLRDIIMEITGLKANDPVTQAIKGTFNVVKSFVPAGTVLGVIEDEVGAGDEAGGGNLGLTGSGGVGSDGVSGEIRLAYNINIVLPETSDLKVLNAIFRSIKENLMR